MYSVSVVKGFMKEIIVKYVSLYDLVLFFQLLMFFVYGCLSVYKRFFCNKFF